MIVNESAPNDVPGAGTYISLAWEAAVVAVRNMPALFGSAAFLCVLMKSIDLVVDQQATLLASYLGNPNPVVLIWSWKAASTVLDAMVLGPVAVAVHRMILLRERTPGLIAWNHPRIWRFIGWALILELVMDIAALSVSAISDSSKLFALIIFAVPVVILSIRSLLVFPAIAVDTPAEDWKKRIATSWNSTHGLFWTLSLAILGAIITLYLPLFAIGSMFFLFSGERVLEHFAFHAGNELIDALLEPVDVALTAAVASWCYMWLHQNNDDVPPKPNDPTAHTSA
jgi:hypothetical protein